MRCFVAVDISDRVRDQIGEYQKRLGPMVAGIRWVRPDRMHLTLAFLGEVSDEFITSAKEKLAEAVKGLKPFMARFEGIGAFSSPRRARVIWAGMSDGRDELCALQNKVVSGLQKVGFEPERRRFSPHLTLGRLRIPADVARVCEQQFQSDEFEIDRVILYQSVLKPEGPEYTRLAEFPLEHKYPRTEIEPRSHEEHETEKQ